MKFYDNHTHSQFSPDSRMTLEEAVSRASAMNLAGISITDHLDLDAPERPQKKYEFFFDPALQQEEIDKLRDLSRIPVFKGIEVGLQPHNIDKIVGFTSRYRFDVVIASLHFIDGLDPYNGGYYNGKDYKAAYGRALETMYGTIAAYKDFDILGHFDYIVRYAPYEERNIAYDRFKDEIDPILQFLAREGKALEINTNTYRERNGSTPVFDTAILKRFKELGGEAVSLGSDAHEPERLADNFPKYKEIVRDCGFDHLVYFKDRQPEFYPIR